MESTSISTRSRTTPRSATAPVPAAASTSALPLKRLRLKMDSANRGGNSGGTRLNSFLGPYDRELDSEGEEDLVFEEQFLLRLPPAQAEEMRERVKNREIGEDVWFKFKDSRRAAFHMNDTTYSAKLVDMPSIIECHKTLDKKKLFKIADICQMIVVEEPVESESIITENKQFRSEDYLWPHGLTPPMRHARRRRFRKRMSKATIETVEEEVERLLSLDSQAQKLHYEILDNVDADLSDSEFMTPPPESGMMTGQGSEVGEDGDTSMFGDTADASKQDDGDFDEDLAAEIDKELAGGSDEEEEDNSSEDEDEDEDEEDDDEDGEDAGADANPEGGVNAASLHQRLMQEEIRDVELAVAKKQADIANATMPIIKKRQEDALRKLMTDLEFKRAQLAKNLRGGDDEESDADDGDGDEGDDGDVVMIS